MKDERKLFYSLSAGEISVDGEVLRLPKKERELLVYLIEHPDTVHTKEKLIEAVWGYDALGQSSTLTVHINRLRRKLEIDPACPEIIETAWGKGYRIRSERVAVVE